MAIKKAEQIFEDELSGEPLSQDMVIEAIKCAQVNAINEAVKLCAENAEIIKYDEHMQFSPYISEFSILSVADKLIKEL